MGHRRTVYGLYCLSAIVLVAGVGSAVWIYRAAARQTAAVAAPYELNPEYSKQYQRELELYGGQANVLAYEIREWFVGLWHGASLAYMVGGSAILVALVLWYAADHVRAREHT